MDSYSSAPSNVPPASDSGLHLPLAFGLFAACVFLTAQISVVSQGAKTMHWQASNYDKQLTNLADGEKQLADLIKQRDNLVQQSAQVRNQYTALLNDVLDLAKDDEDAKKVVQKWNIQRQTPPAEDTSKPKTP